MAELLKNVTNPHVSGTGLIDLAGMLVAKRIIDGASMPIVGNNNLISGVAKLAVFGMLHGKGGRIGGMITGGGVLDGVDDIAGVVMGKIGIGRSAQAANQELNPGF